MIQNQTILKVADNSGAKTVKCIKVLGGFKRKYAKIGDIIIVSIQELKDKNKKTSKIKKGDVCKGLLIRTKKAFFNKTGEKVQFNDNAIVLINKQNVPVGTRILGGLPFFLKKKKFQKIISISSGIL